MKTAVRKKNVNILPPSPAGNAFCKTDQAVRDYTREHKAPLTAAEHEELGELLRERARRISDVLGVHVGSVAD